MKRKGILFVISAPSGAGKTSLCKEVIDILPDLRHSVSYTTRSPRMGEVHGKDYFFVPVEQFRAMIEAGEFAEWAEVHGNFYGTSLRTLEEARDAGIDILLDIDCQGGRQLREKWDSGVFVFIFPPNFTELRRRLVSRNLDSEETIQRRIRNAEGEIRQSVWYDYLIVNDVFSKAVEDLKAVFLAERCRRRIAADQVAALFPELFIPDFNS